MPHKVLVTGASGYIGRAIVRKFREDGHWVRGLDQVEPTADCHEFIQADLEDREAVRAAVKGMDSVFHMAAEPDDADFVDGLLKPNVLGLYHVCDAAGNGGVKRLVLASSIQVGSPWFVEAENISPDDPPFINNHYSLTKVWAEQMGEFYARLYSLSVIAARIGWVPRSATVFKSKSRIEKWKLKNFFFNLEDVQNFFACCLNAENPKAGEFFVTFALSQQLGPPWIDQSRAREVLGYEPGPPFPYGLELHEEN